MRTILTLLLFLAAVTPSPAQEPPAPERSRDTTPDRWLGPDKAAHVFGGYWSAGVGYAAASRLDADRSGRRAAAIGAGAVAGLAKEAFDRFVQKERFSWKDLVADAAGIAILLAVTAAAEP